MFIITAKLNKKRAITVVLALAIFLTAIILLAGLGSKEKEEPTMQKTEETKVKTNEDRVNFLSQFGWEVQQEPIEQKEIQIPQEFGEVYENYNALQLSQNFDLSQYKGESATRYTYEVKNHPQDTERVVADLLVYKDKVIGGSVQSTTQNGFMHGFSAP